MWALAFIITMKFVTKDGQTLITNVKTLEILKVSKTGKQVAIGSIPKDIVGNEDKLNALMSKLLKEEDSRTLPAVPDAEPKPVGTGGRRGSVPDAATILAPTKPLSRRRSSLGEVTGIRVILLFILSFPSFLLLWSSFFCRSSVAFFFLLSSCSSSFILISFACSFTSHADEEGEGVEGHGGSLKLGRRRRR